MSMQFFLESLLRYHPITSTSIPYGFFKTNAASIVGLLSVSFLPSLLSCAYRKQFARSPFSFKKIKLTFFWPFMFQLYYFSSNNHHYNLWGNLQLYPKFDVPGWSRSASLYLWTLFFNQFHYKETRSYESPQSSVKFNRNFKRIPWPFNKPFEDLKNRLEKSSVASLSQ